MLQRHSLTRQNSSARENINGDIAVLNTVMPNAVQPTVTLDTDTASKLTKKVLEAYLNVLKDGGATYAAIRNRYLCIQSAQYGQQ